jgi:hypothetical protein
MGFHWLLGMGEWAMKDARNVEMDIMVLGHQTRERLEAILYTQMQIDMSVEDQWAYEWVSEVYYIDTRKEVNV